MPARPGVVIGGSDHPAAAPTRKSPKAARRVRGLAVFPGYAAKRLALSKPDDFSAMRNGTPERRATLYASPAARSSNSPAPTSVWRMEGLQYSEIPGAGRWQYVVDARRERRT